jgi:hypothetical protein
MEYKDKINEIINNVPISIKIVKDVLINRSDRLIYLLWTKNENYEGPLFNSYQENEWSSIIILLGDWLLESYIELMKKKKNITKEVKDLFEVNNIVKLSTYILKSILESSILGNKNMLDNLGILNNLDKFPKIFEMLRTEISEHMNLITNLTDGCCCTGKCNVNKVLKNMFKLAEETGKISAKINMILNSKKEDINVESVSDRKITLNI